jgi:hypothetical protein
MAGMIRLLTLFILAIPAIAAADPATTLNLPAAVKHDDGTPYFAFEIDSTRDGKVTSRIEIQSLPEFGIYCKDDASECSNSSGGSVEYVIRTDGTDDPGALKDANTHLSKVKFQSIPTVDLKDGAAKVGDVKVSLPASQQPNSVDLTLNGKKAMTVKLAGVAPTRTTLKRVAIWNGWLLVEAQLVNDKNSSNTWFRVDIRGYK